MKGKTPAKVRKHAPAVHYSGMVCARICARLAAGESLLTICKDADMPNVVTVYRWIGDHPDFRAMIEKARMDQADTIADEILAIADTEPDPQKARVMIDARKWYASKVRPDKYGERQQIQLSVKPAAELTDDELARIAGGAGVIEAARPAIESS